MTDENFTWYHDDVDHVPMHPHNDWIVDRCADHCDDQLPLFSRVGRGLQGNGYIVEKAIDNESQTILVGSIIDPRTGEKTEQWRTGNINGGRLHYTKNINPATNPQTFTLTFTLDRPDDPDRGWTFTTPAIPYVWTDEPNTYVSSLFVKAVGDPDWTEIPEALMTPHSIDESLAKIEKLIYPEAILDRDELHAPQPGDPNTVNLTYGLGGDINVPNLDNLARILGVNPNSLKALANNGEDATRYPSFGTGRNAKEYIDWHLHQDLGGGDGLPNVPPDLNLTPLKGDGGNKTVWDWIQYAINQAKEHLHKDLYGGLNSEDYNEIPVNLKPLAGDENNGRTVWDWIKWGRDQAKTYAKTLFDKVTDPTSYTVNLAEAIGVDAVYLVMIKPTGVLNSRAIVSPIPAGSVLAAIEADVTVQFYDSLPDTIVSVVPKAGATAIGESPYAGNDSVNLGTGEMLVVCTPGADEGSYIPVNLKRTITTTSGGSTVSKTIKAPASNPEQLVNSGIGQIGTVADVSADRIYNDYQSYCVPNHLGPVFNDGTLCYGNWAIYTGVGNPSNNPQKNSRSGGWKWIVPNTNEGIYIYLFNRSTGYLGTRVHVDYARGYSTSFR